MARSAGLSTLRGMLHPGGVAILWARMHPMLILKLMFVLALANGAPVIGKKILKNRFTYPLDGGLRLPDGQPLFGASKTLRGILLSLIVTAGLAPLFGVSSRIGLVAAAAAMTGDLFSSFVKRRMKLPPSSQALGLDQIPESLFPLIAVKHASGLSIADIAIGVAIFFIGELLLSRLLFKFKLRDRPY